jgi:hypothetical protein
MIKYITTKLLLHKAFLILVCSYTIGFSIRKPQSLPLGVIIILAQWTSNIVLRHYELKKLK